VAGGSLLRDPHGDRSTGWWRAGRSVSGPVRHTRTGFARSATNASLLASPSFSGNGASGLRDPGKSPRGPWSASASALRAASSMAVAGTRYRERYGPISDLARFRVVAANTVPARAMRCYIGNENYSGRYRAIFWIGARVTRQREAADQGRRWCPGAELNHRHTDFQSVALPTELPGRLARGAYRGDRACLSSRALPGWLSNSNRSRVRADKFFVD
jgi:hypothetical protein